MKKQEFIDVWNGTMRANVTYLVVITACIGFYFSRLTDEGFNNVLIMVVSFSFGRMSGIDVRQPPPPPQGPS